MKEVIQVGKHTVGYDEETGFIHLCHVGTMDGAEMTAVADRISEYCRKYHPGEPAFELVDNRKSTGFTRDARIALSNHPMAREEVYAAMWGASFGVRTFINLVFRALAVATGSKSTAHATVTEAEASEWLIEKRNLYRSRKAKDKAA